jgi:hypothetical protein
VLVIFSAATLPLCGKASDLWGKKRMLLAIVMPESPYRVRQRLDSLGSVLIYVSEGSSWGWGTLSNLVYLFGGLVLLAAFLVWESRIANPLIELSLLRNQILAGIAAEEHIPVALIQPYIHFQGDINYPAGFSVFQIAWHLTIPLSVVGMIAGPLGGLLARRYGAGLALIISGVALIVAFEALDDLLKAETAYFEEERFRANLKAMRERSGA